MYNQQLNSEVRLVFQGHITGKIITLEKIIRNKRKNAHKKTPQSPERESLLSGSQLLNGV